ncbi:MAG TPA: hypothetical protein VGG10_00325 [Rhizomicrobium sp.]|jgi:hypothetical protein
MENATELVDRYVALWNESDADKRRLAIVELWAPDGLHLAKRHECAGYAMIENRVVRSYEASIAPGLNVFRHANNIDAHHNIVRFNWHMVRKVTGEIAATGFEMLVLGNDGRIQADYQFNDPA